MKIERHTPQRILALAERRKVTMAKLRMMTAVFFLTVALAASFGVDPVAATGPEPEGEARLARRTLDSDFLRHNVGAGFHAAVTESTPRRGMHDIDFVRHNYGAHSWAVDVDARKPLRTQSDQERIEYRQNKR